MRMRFVTRQLAAAVMSGIALGGCGSISEEFGYNGVGIPKTSQIAAYYADAGNQAILNGETGSRIARPRSLFRRAHLRQQARSRALFQSRGD